jgi:hypothetical protein
VGIGYSLPMTDKCESSGIALLKEQIKHERELREQTARNNELALEKQASEYERRLDELNHAHARSLEDRTQFLQANIYEQTQKELAAWKLQVTTDTTIMAERLKADQVATATALASNQRMVNWIMSALMIMLAVANFLYARK